MGDKIQISKDGFLFSFERYLADASPGFLLYFSLITLMITKIVDDSILKWLINSTIELKICYGIFLIIIVVPLGMIINAFSYCLLDGLITGFSKIFFCNILLVNSKKETSFNELIKYLNINRSNYLEKGYKLRRTIEIIENYDINKTTIGFHKLTRNISFMILFLLFLPEMEINKIIIIIALFITFFILSSLYFFYYNATIFNNICIRMIHGIIDVTEAEGLYKIINKKNV